MTNELKPCPFCGGKAMSYDYEAGNFYPNYIVECCNCSARIKPLHADSYDAEKEAIKEWNTRQPDFDWKHIEELVNEKDVDVIVYADNKITFPTITHIHVGFDGTDKDADVSYLVDNEFIVDKKGIIDFLHEHRFTHYALITPPSKD